MGFQQLLISRRDFLSTLSVGCDWGVHIIVLLLLLVFFFILFEFKVTLDFCRVENGGYNIS